MNVVKSPVSDVFQIETFPNLSIVNREYLRRAYWRIYIICSTVYKRDLFYVPHKLLASGFATNVRLGSFCINTEDGFGIYFLIFGKYSILF